MRPESRQASSLLKLLIQDLLTFHIVLQNDNPLVAVTFDPDHLAGTRRQRVKGQVARNTNFNDKSFTSYIFYKLAYFYQSLGRLKIARSAPHRLPPSLPPSVPSLAHPSTSLKSLII